MVDQVPMGDWLCIPAQKNLRRYGNLNGIIGYVKVVYDQ